MISDIQAIHLNSNPLKFG